MPKCLREKISSSAFDKIEPLLKEGLGSHTIELIFQNVKIPVENLVGSLGEGFNIAMTALDSGRITVGANAIGIARTAFEFACRHAREREQFGKPIGNFQGISFMIADMATQLDAARLMVQCAA